MKPLVDTSHGKRQFRRLDSDRAGFVTCHAGETAVHLLNEVGRQFEFSFKSLASKRRAPARRSGFLEMLAVGRADRETQSATYAVYILKFIRLLVQF